MRRRTYITQVTMLKDRRQHMKHITVPYVSRCGMRRKYEQQR